MNLYSQAQVNSTLTRALKCMFVISDYIEQGFWYFDSQEYTNIKDQQYDIYTLWTCISQQEPFINFAVENDTFNQLIGWLISKLSQYDTFGAFGDNQVNPNYQGSGIVIDVEGGEVIPDIITDIFQGVTPVVITVPYTGFTNPTVLFRDSSGNNYTPVNYQDTGTDVVVTSPDDGTGHSADTYTVIIKP